MANLNLDDILELFENGERRYEEDPAFKAVADSLKMGLGVYAVLDHTLKAKNYLANKLALALKNIAQLENVIADRDEDIGSLCTENEKLKKEIKEQERYINHLRD